MRQGPIVDEKGKAERPSWIMIIEFFLLLLFVDILLLLLLLLLLLKIYKFRISSKSTASLHFSQSNSNDCGICEIWLLNFFVIIIRRDVIIIITTLSVSAFV